MAKTCSFCNNKIGLLKAHLAFKDGYMCKDCVKKYGGYTNLPVTTAFATNHSVEDFHALLKTGNDFRWLADEHHRKQKAARADFARQLERAKTNKASKFGHYYIDLKAGQIVKTRSMLQPPVVYDFKDVVSYQVNKNWHTENKQHSITRAMVGGAIAGDTGALIGAMTGDKSKDYLDHLGLVINLADGNSFEIVIHSNGKIKGRQADACYRSLNELVGQIKAGMATVANEKQLTTQPTEVQDAADQIAKFKKLADEGIITQEEFEAKKKQLLGL